MMTGPVYPPETTFHSCPTVMRDRQFGKLRELARGDFLHRRERPVLSEYAAGHFLPICEQSFMDFRKGSRLDPLGELLGELIHNLDQNLCIAHLGERPGG